MELRRLTKVEEDLLGFSEPEECGICPPGHICGGCGALIMHWEGSTCPACWKVVLDAQRG